MTKEHPLKAEAFARQYEEFKELVMDALPILHGRMLHKEENYKAEMDNLINLEKDILKFFDENNQKAAKKLIYDFNLTTRTHND